MSDELTPAQRKRFDENRAALDVSSREVEAVDVQVHAARQRVVAVGAELEGLRARGATTNQLAAATTKLQRSKDALAELDGRRQRLVKDVSRIRDRLDRFQPTTLDPAWSLTGAVPLALLPVRIETRFLGGELRIRIFPDAIHVDQLEPLLTADEEAYGHEFWKARWQSSGDDAVACWERFVSGHPPQRVAWIVEQTTPTNIAAIGRGRPTFPAIPIRPPGPSRAPSARLLPGRFVAVGFRAGAEAFRVWARPVAGDLDVGVAPSDPTVPTTDAPPDVQDALALHEGARWLVDYDRAVAAGMAITIRAADATGPMNQGFDRVVVVGVDHRRDAAAAAAALEDLLRAHHATDGFGFVPAGTATNATEATDVVPRQIAGDPSAPAPARSPGAAADVAAAALGLSADGVLARVNGAGDVHDPLAQAMLTALWEPTLGYFGRQMMAPLVSETRSTQLRDHVRSYVRPRGPLPLCRVGRQPMGMLPIVALGTFTGSDAERFVADVLRAVRPLWDSSANSALRLGDSGDPAADLVEILERADRSIAYRLRQAYGLVTLANTEGGQAIALMQQAAAQLALAMLGVTGRPGIVDITVADDDFVAPIPLVTGAELSDSDPLAPDYVARLASRASTPGGLRLLREDPEHASTLLEALLTHATDLEIGRASTHLVIDHLELEIDPHVARADAEFRPTVAAGSTNRAEPIAVIDAGTPVAHLNVPPSQVAEHRIAGISGRLSIEGYLAEQSPTKLRQVIHTRQLGEFRDALAQLTGQPTAELHRAAAEALDAVSHRYDAWLTSLATRRLAAQRAKAPDGVHVGAFGWVDDLRPATARASAGYVHGPSIPHATTAAILRSGHLGRNDANDDALAIDLSSRRVRDARRLVEGIHAGQSIGALLGYRYERGLRDHGATHAAYILPSRLQHPLPGSGDADATGGAPTEAIAARNVVDGLALAQLDPAGRSSFLTAVGVSAGHRPAVEALLDDLAASLDALADLLVSEGVFQAVVGNAERAAAAMDALDRQLPIPDPGIARTPRTGTGLAHRLIVVLDDERPPAAWNRLTDVRGNAEPRVNAWIGRALGDPDRYRLAADALDADGNVVQTLTTDIAALGMSPLAIVLAASQGSDQTSELEARLWALFNGMAPADTTLRARPEPAPDAPAGSAGLGELMTLARGIADLIGSVRAAAVGDFAHPNDRYEPAPDVAELGARAGAVAAENERVAATDDDLSILTTAQLVRTLRRAADLGMRAATPRTADRAALEVQLRRVVDNARIARDRLAALDAGLASTAAPNAYQLAVHHEARLRAVLGERMPVVPRLALPDDLRTVLDASLADAALVGRRTGVVTEWVMQHTRVRPSIERLYGVLAAAESRATGIDATQFVVAQLPVRAGDPWIGRADAFGPGAPARIADTSLVIHRTAARRTRIGRKVAALVVDQWSEQVPRRTETTGVSFHFDGPGSRAPQTMLLAVHPDPAATAWSTDVVIDTVVEAAELARIRTLDLDDVIGAGRFLPAAYLAFNLERQIPTVDFARLVENSIRDWPTWERPI